MYETLFQTAFYSGEIRQIIWGFKPLNIFQHFSLWKTCKSEICHLRGLFVHQKKLIWCLPEQKLPYLETVTRKKSLNQSEKLIQWILLAQSVTPVELVSLMTPESEAWCLCPMPCHTNLSQVSRRRSVAGGCAVCCGRGWGDGSLAQTRGVFWGNMLAGSRWETWSILHLPADVGSQSKWSKKALGIRDWIGFVLSSVLGAGGLCSRIQRTWRQPSAAGELLAKVKLPHVSQPAKCAYKGVFSFPKQLFSRVPTLRQTFYLQGAGPLVYRDFSLWSYLCLASLFVSVHL